MLRRGYRIVPTAHRAMRYPYQDKREYGARHLDGAHLGGGFESLWIR